MILDILLVQYINYASFEEIRIFGIPKREEQMIHRVATEGISPRWKISFQTSGKLDQYEQKSINFILVTLQILNVP
jgi:hypothetical protein